MAKCSSCKQEIIWTISPAGARLPLAGRKAVALDAAGSFAMLRSPVTYFIRDEAGEKHAVKATGDEPADELYVSHWVTCPTRAQHVKAKR